MSIFPGNVNTLAPAAPGAPTHPPLVAFTGAASSTADAAAHTFAAQPFGAEHASRVILVGVTSQDTGNQIHELATVTVAGVSATVRAQSGLSGDKRYAQLWSAPVPTGAAGDIVVTNVGGVLVDRRAVFVYRAWSLDSEVPHQAASLSGNPSPAGSIDVPADGFAIGVACAFDANAFTWSGLTEDADLSLSGRRASSASRLTDAQLLGLAVEATHPTSAASRGCLASWAPA